MKLITFDGGRVGRLELEEGVVIELDVPSTREYFERGGDVRETGERLAYADVKLEAPIRPKKFFHTAGNFADHHNELTAVDWSHPVHKGIVFFQNVDAIIGPDDDIVYPDDLTKEMDYELELAIVIGKSGKFFGPDEADDYIAGFTVFNDISARDIQRKEMESGVFSFSKAIDTFCPIGPWIVTRDEVPDMHELPMQLRVNGEVRQQGNTNQTAHQVPAPGRVPLAADLQRGRPHHDRHHLGRRRGAAEPVRLLPEARRPDRGRDHRHRHAPQQGHQLGRALRRARPAAGRLVKARQRRRAALALDHLRAMTRSTSPPPPTDASAPIRRRCSTTGRRSRSGPQADGQRLLASSSDRRVRGTDLGAPVPRPRQVFAIGLNYAEHAAEAGYPPDAMPVTFTKFPSSIAGPTRRRAARGARRLGGRARRRRSAGSRTRSTAKSAWNHVAGLTIGQDLSERITQLQGTAPAVQPRQVVPRLRPDRPVARHARRVRRPRRPRDLVRALSGEVTAVLPHVDHDLRRPRADRPPVGRRARCCRATSSSRARRPGSATRARRSGSSARTRCSSRRSRASEHITTRFAHLTAFPLYKEVKQ